MKLLLSLILTLFTIQINSHSHSHPHSHFHPHPLILFYIFNSIHLIFRLLHYFYCLFLFRSSVLVVWVYWRFCVCISFLDYYHLWLWLAHVLRLIIHWLVLSISSSIWLLWEHVSASHKQLLSVNFAIHVRINSPKGIICLLLSESSWVSYSCKQIIVEVS